MLAFSSFVSARFDEADLRAAIAASVSEVLRGDTPDSVLQRVAGHTALGHELQHSVDLFSTSHGFLFVTRIHAALWRLTRTLLRVWHETGQAGVHVRDLPDGMPKEWIEQLRYPRHPTGPFCCERVSVAGVAGATPDVVPLIVHQAVTIDGVTVTVPAVHWRSVVGARNGRLVYHQFVQPVDCQAVLECLGFHIQRQHAYELGVAAGGPALAAALDVSFTAAMTGDIACVTPEGDFVNAGRWEAGRIYETFATYLRRQGLDLSRRGLFAAGEYALMTALPWRLTDEGAFEVVVPPDAGARSEANVGERIRSLVERLAQAPGAQQEASLRALATEEVRARADELAEALRQYWMATVISRDYEEGWGRDALGREVQRRHFFRVLAHWIQEYVSWLPFRRCGALAAHPDMFLQACRPGLMIQGPGDEVLLLGFGYEDEVSDALDWMFSVAVTNDILVERKTARCPLRHRGGGSCHETRPVLDTCRQLLREGGFDTCGELPSTRPHPKCGFHETWSAIVSMGAHHDAFRKGLVTGDDFTTWQATVPTPPPLPDGLPMPHLPVDIDWGGPLESARLEFFDSVPERAAVVLWNVGVEGWPWSMLAKAGAVQSIAFGLPEGPALPGGPGALRLALSLVAARALEPFVVRPISIDGLGGLFIKGRPLGRLRLMPKPPRLWAHLFYAEQARMGWLPWASSIVESARHPIRDLRTFVDVIRTVLAYVPVLDTQWLASAEVAEEVERRTWMFRDQPAVLEIAPRGEVVGLVSRIGFDGLVLRRWWRPGEDEPISETALSIALDDVQSASFLPRKPAFVVSFDQQEEGRRSPRNG